MNLKMVIIPLAICSSVLAMDSSQETCYSAPYERFGVKSNAEFRKYDVAQKEAIENFVNEVTEAWVLEAIKVGASPSDIRQERTLMRAPAMSGVSLDAGSYYTSVYQLRCHPSAQTYKTYLRSQLKMGFVDLRLFEYLRRYGTLDAISKLPQIPTPQKMKELLPDLVETLGITVYPKDYANFN
jgi:hypothetical protein